MVGPVLQWPATITGGQIDMQIVHWTDVEEQPADGVEGVTIRWVIDDKGGAPHFALRVLDVQPGCATPYHTHWWEHEVFVLAGEGLVVYEGGETPISPGTTLLVDGDEVHCFRNTGEDVLRFICLIPHKWLEGLAAKHAS
jgi:quercetin dioxygenase-like cupin family protein